MSPRAPGVGSRAGWVGPRWHAAAPCGPTASWPSAGPPARWGAGGSAASCRTPPAAPRPWATLTVNLVGCLAIGVLLAVLLDRFPAHPWLRPLLATGVLGGFTTFSAFAVDAVQLVDAGRWPVAVGYVLVSVVGGLAAVVLGLLLGRRAVR